MERIIPNLDPSFVVFSNIVKDTRGKGICFVYNARMKTSRMGKPFATLYLRDAQGVCVPGYVFDLASPLVAGGELANAINKIVEIEWQENYLPGVGLTLILDKVSIVHDAPTSVVSKFNGAVEDVDKKVSAITSYLSEVLDRPVNLSWRIPTMVAEEYCQGRVGGLAEHYYRMTNVLRGMTHFTEQETYNLVATFLLYISAHSVCVRAKAEGTDNIALASKLVANSSKLAEQLGVGTGALEVVHMFFGYEPKDIYVRTIVAVSEMVHRFDKEFNLYHTIPLEQEGDAGYGKIRRYKIE